MKTEKKYLMYGIALILLTLVGVSLAYFVTEIVGNKKSVSVSTGDLRIVFTDTDGSITGNDIEPGWNTTKTFSVENKTNSSYDYNIIIEDLVNTFSTEGYLVYKITSTDGGYNMSDYVDVPKSNTAKDTVLAYSISIPSKTTHNYTIEIKYLNDEENSQNIDMNSILSGNIYITKGGYDLLGAILRDNPIVSERTDFSAENNENTTGIIFKTHKTEDSSTVYYYSGNTTNNWVKFGKENKTSCTYNGNEVINGNNGLVAQSKEECILTNVCFLLDTYYIGASQNQCTSAGGSYIEEKAIWNEANSDIYWRIIRTNEDGSIRLLYAGTSHDTTEGYIGKSAFNSTYNESRYVGYMYGGNTSLKDNRNNTTSSTIKGVIDRWYQKNLLTNYDKYISKSAIYCNDRSIDSSEFTWSNNGDHFDFGATTRLYKNIAPTYKCGGNTSGGLFESTQASQDKFSASTTGGGNGQLTYPVALMTADEASFAGGVQFEELSSPYVYYYTNSVGKSITGSISWWLLSPSDWYSGGHSNSYYAGGSYLPASVGDGSVGASGGVRPVLSISSCAQVTGTGTPTDPYVIDEANSTC